MAANATELRGKRIALVGFGVESAALARFAVSEGAASITVTDTRSAEQLAGMVASVADLPMPVRLVAGGNPPEAWADADVIFVSPGITPGFTIGIPGIAEAAARGAVISNHTQLLFERSPAPIVGITGSAGKTTTTTLLGTMLAAQGGRRVLTGGNMGVPLINDIGALTRDDVVVLEISEVQLARLTRSPHVGAITNITPDHFDRYGTFERYVEAKRRMVQFMQPDDYAILNADNAPSRDSAAMTRAQVLLFSSQQPVELGADASDGGFWVRLPDRAPVRICGVEETPLLGQHNVENILAASLAAMLMGATPEVLATVIRGFNGVRNRLEFVREWHGVRFYNDSIATSPGRALAGLRTFTAPILLLAGGKNKQLPWDEIAEVIVRKVRVLTVMGVSASFITEAIAQAQATVPTTEQLLERVERVASIEDATHLLAEAARPGEVVLLSPGCASHDMFVNFEERGQRFADVVHGLPE